MKYLIYFHILMLCATTSFAQKNGMGGRLVDVDRKMGMKGVSLQVVLHSSVRDTMQTVSGDDGLFHFERIPTEGFTLIVRKNDTLFTERSYNKPAAGLRYFDLGLVIAEANFQTLTEIVVQSPPVLFKEDTIEYRTAGFLVPANASVEALLKKLPGIQIARDGTISIQGKQITRIKVNGKDFFKGDPKMVLKELPAALIDKVQIVDDYGEAAALTGIRNGEPDKIINLQLKKDKNRGVFGKGQLGLGDQQRFLGGLSVNRFNGGKQLSLILNSNNTNEMLLSQVEAGGASIGGAGATPFSSSNGIGNGTSTGNLTGGVNHQSGEGLSRSNTLGIQFRSDFGKRNSVYGSYTLNGLSNWVNQFSATNYLMSPSIWGSSVDHKSDKSLRHQAVLHLEWRIDSMNYIKISPSFSFRESGCILTNRTSLYQSNPSNNLVGLNFDSSGSNRLSLGTTIFFQHQFYKQGRNLTVNFDWTGTPSQLYQQRTSDLSHLDEKGALVSQSIQLQKIEQISRNLFATFQTTYTEPLGRQHFIDLSYHLVQNRTANNRQAFLKDPETGRYVFSDSLSNIFEMGHHGQKIGIAMRRQSKKITYSMGVFYQPSVLKGAVGKLQNGIASFRNRLWFPQARLSYHFSRSRTLTISYNGNAQQPAFEQLQPVRNTTNQQFYSEGNPLLRPTVSHTLNTGYNQLDLNRGSVLLLNASFSKINHQIVNHLIFLNNPDGSFSGTQLTRPENVQGSYHLNLFYFYSRPILNRKCAFSLSGSFQYNRNKTKVNYKEQTGHNWLLNQGVVFNLNLPWLETSAGIRYNGNWVRFLLGESVKRGQSTWTVTHDLRIRAGKHGSVNWEWDYSFNRGFANGVGSAIALWNVSLEKELFPEKNGTLKLAGYDLLNQNKAVMRSVNSIVVTDTRTNRLGRYFMVSFIYRLSQFKPNAHTR